MVFTYIPHPFVPDLSGVNQEELKHHYYAQMTMDEEHLVLGMLHQGEPPLIGKWIDVADVDRIFQERYFVQYTDFNTLVPGSLIQGDEVPKGKWKEVKKKLLPPAVPFYHFSFDEPFFVVDFDFNETVAFAEHSDFTFSVMRPVLQQVYPSVSVSFLFCDFFYFKGGYEELEEDVTKLVPFSRSDTQFQINYSDNIEGVVDGYYVLDVANNYQFSVKPGTADGLYTFIMAVRNNSSMPELGHKAYVVLENVLVKV